MYHVHNHHDDGAMTTVGFLFAFLRYDRLPSPTWIQRAVRALSHSDLIHVAVVEVLHASRGEPLLLIVSDRCFTAFVGTGFCVQPTRETLVASGCYDFLFVPVRGFERMQRGLLFLRGLAGMGYNYTGLLLTLLPTPRKLGTPVLPALLSNEQTDTTNTTSTSHQHHHPHYHMQRIFCSQMGLMLCYECEAIAHHIMDPAACSPAELADLLVRHAAATPAHASAIRCCCTPPPLLEPPPPPLDPMMEFGYLHHPQLRLLEQQQEPPGSSRW